ncbi:MAG: transposase, partial [Paludibacter sp.]|nr:transposase [Paludibacter sp.]
MSNWLIRACEDWLEPIYEEMKFRLCEHKVLHADETTLQVLREPGKPASSKSYMCYVLSFGERLKPLKSLMLKPFTLKLIT